MPIKEFTIRGRLRINGISVETGLTVDVNPTTIPTPGEEYPMKVIDDYYTLVSSAQIELRTLMTQTYEALRKTQEALDGKELRQARPVHDEKPRAGRASPKSVGRPRLLRNASGRQPRGKNQSRASSRSG